MSDEKRISIAAAMTLPRVGFVENFGSLLRGLSRHAIPLATTGGVFWEQGITRAIEAQLLHSPGYILTIDYDSVWCSEAGSDDIAKLVCLAEDYPDYDVFVPMQQKREGGELLAESGEPVALSQALVPIRIGHFGLTLFRASVFEKLERPWLKGVPDDEGRWGEDRIDPDIYFWQNCQRSGVKVALTPGVVIGHLEQVVTFPNQDREPLHIPIQKWAQNGYRAPLVDSTDENVVLKMAG